MRTMFWGVLAAVSVAPFLDPKRPLRLLHLDLLVLASFGLPFIVTPRTPLADSRPQCVVAFVGLAYLCVRMVALGVREPAAGQGRLFPLLSVRSVAACVLILACLQPLYVVVTHQAVIDVGEATLIGAQRVATGQTLYEGRLAPRYQDDARYGPVMYLAYVPFERALPWRPGGTLLGARLASFVFGLAVAGTLYATGRRLRRGPTGHELGVAMAFGWMASPYSFLAATWAFNDAVPALLVALTLLALQAPLLAGAALGAASAAKFVPVIAAPVLAVHRPEKRSALMFTLAVLVVSLVAIVLFLPDGGPRELYQRTIGWQSHRFNYGSLWRGVPVGVLDAARVAAACFALGLAWLARGASIARTTAFATAALVAAQLTATYWLPTYALWFFPLLLAALFVRELDPPAPTSASGGQAPIRVQRVREQDS